MNPIHAQQAQSVGQSSAMTPLQKWVYLCFFLSGMDALIYEVSWLNRIQLVMGHTVYSLATTLAAYMTGLALGALCVPRIKKTGINALALYLGAELLIGLYGLAFFPLLKLTQLPYDWIVSHFQFSLITLSFIQFIFCTVLIIIPTFLMGITLPLIGPYIYPRANEISEKIPTLYGFNTLGAMVGSFTAGYLILPNLGYVKTSQLAAGINIGLFFMVTFMANFEGKGAALESTSASLGSLWKALVQVGKAIFSRANAPTYSGPLVRTPQDRWSLFVLFISGFTGMLTQVSWNRLAGLGFGPTTYIFSMVATVVLGGIVIGSWIWRKSSSDPEKAQRMFIILPFFAGVSLLIGNYFFTQTPRLVLYWNLTIDPGFWLRSFFELMWTFFCLLPAATFTGSLFPAAISQLTRNQTADQATRSLSRGYATNIAGLMVGALLGSFLLLPYFGIENICRGLVVLLFALSGCLALSTQKRVPIAAAIWTMGLIGISIVPSFDWNLLTSGYFYNRNRKLTSESLRESGWVSPVPFLSIRAPMIARKDDPHATISIHEGKLDKNYRSFKVNGKVDGTNSGDLKTTRLLSAYPAMVRPDAKSALIIGLGTGSTAAQTLRYPQMEKVKVIELSSAMVEFARKYFGSVDGEIWDDPRFVVEQRDGRDFLDHTRETYDVIISEPSNPWVDGVASLFTQEFYESVSKRLNPGGVASLWFHSYGLDCQVVQSVLSAAGEVFPSLLVFSQGGDIFMLASKDPDGLILRPIPREAQILEMILFRENGVTAGMSQQEGYRKVLEKTLIYDRDGAINLSFLAPVNRDDNQYLQFRSGQTFSSGISCRDFPGSASPSLIDKYSMGFRSLPSATAPPSGSQQMLPDPSLESGQ